MIPKECKRLAEVDFPIAIVGRHALAEKARRTGTPHQLHHWWAWRPLASSRAVLLAILIPDPCDKCCPDVFKQEARRILLCMQGRPQGWTETIKSDEGLRRIILKFIADFASWDYAADRSYLTAGRALVRAAHGEETPLVVDPFSGGGSIPLEALRLGCEAFASDLNPVACLISNTKLSGIQRHGLALANELREVGGKIKRQVEQELADLYPADSDGATPIAYLWARTVRCEAPNCGAEIPLMRSFWLCKKPRRKWALRVQVERHGEARAPEVAFEVFEPSSEKEVRGGTVTLAKATCLCCHMVLPPKRVRAQLAAQRGGADVVFDDNGQRTGGARMTAVVTLKLGETGRNYRLPTAADYAAVKAAQQRLAAILKKWEDSGKQGPCPVPDEPLPPIGTLGFRVQRYGMLQWGDLFTARQRVSFLSLASLIRNELDGASISEDCASLLAMVCSKLTDRCNSLVNWSLGVECADHLFKANALPMGWDYAESNFLSPASGSISATLTATARNAQATVISGVPPPSALQADAMDNPLPDQSAHVWFTDPPYYDAVPYADLSDFFLVWLKRVLPHNSLLRDLSDPDNPLSPKTREIVQDETKHEDGRPKNRAWFEESMAKAFSEARRVLRDDGLGSVVFAHKTTEGWEAFLSAMIRGGFVVTASWPIATERAARMRARDSAALAASVHLICRPRPENAPVGDWAEVLRALSERVAEWMAHLQDEGIRGADLVFACIGPALEIFSRYRAVETAEGHTVGLDAYLEKVWEVVGRAALQQVLGAAEAQAGNGFTGALEEDARLTALFLWTRQSTGAADESSPQDAADDLEDEEPSTKASAKGYSLPFDVVRRFAQPMGIDLAHWTGRIIGQEKGVVRLLPVSERARDLFGRDGAAAAAEWIEHEPQVSLQQTLFPDWEDDARPRNRRGRKTLLGSDAELQPLDATTLDRVHAAMLFQASGHTAALRKLIVDEQERGPDFLRLANALSALYPRGSEDKRLLDAMLLAAPR